eukprot:gene17683-24617_t
MYKYDDYDHALVRERVAQFRNQTERFLKGELTDEEFRPLRLQNGWYVQRHAPMLRVAVPYGHAPMLRVAMPYGELSSAQVRVLAKIAREYDQPSNEIFQGAIAAQNKLGDIQLRDGKAIGSKLVTGYAHFTTRQNVQFNWIPLDQSADVMDLLASVGMHGIQTSGNCIRNITSDERAGIAIDEIADPRPFAEIMRQWSTLHPEFAFLPRKFKVAITGAREDRSASAWHDVGLQLLRNAEGTLGFKVLVGGGMGRTPVIATTIREFLPCDQILNYVEAVVRVYNRWGRRDNKYKARIKILVKALGIEAFSREVEEEWQYLRDGPAQLTDAEYTRVASAFVPPAYAHLADTSLAYGTALADNPHFARWVSRNVMPHKVPGYTSVVLSTKPGISAPPGDVTARQMDAVAQWSERFGFGEIRIAHEQNIVLPDVPKEQLHALWTLACEHDLGAANIGLLTDIIACPGGDFCALANAKSIPIAQAIQQRFDNLDYLHDLGDISLNISGCINACGHHHIGNIGILGVDKNGSEWYQITLGGSDGSTPSGAAVAGKVIGPSFAADEVPDVIEAVIETYRGQRAANE